MKDKHVSIPMTILSLAIGIIVIFPIIWLVLSSFKPSGELFTYPLHMFPSPRRRSIISPFWTAASWAM